MIRREARLILLISREKFLSHIHNFILDDSLFGPWEVLVVFYYLIDDLILFFEGVFFYWLFNHYLLHFFGSAPGFYEFGVLFWFLLNVLYWHRVIQFFLRLFGRLLHVIIRECLTTIRVVCTFFIQLDFLHILEFKLVWKGLPEYPCGVLVPITICLNRLIQRWDDLSRPACFIIHIFDFWQIQLLVRAKGLRLVML